jgi:DegV family protein with EDD domain
LAGETTVQIVTDTGADLWLTPQEQADLNIHVVPQLIMIDGKSYRSGIDIQSHELYRMMLEENCMPTTGVPSMIDFASVYQQLAVDDPDILSIHMAGCLSSTCSVASAAAQLVPEANITVYDSRIISVVQGWLVVAAARAAKAGWNIDQIRPMLDRLLEVSDTILTVSDIRHLVHGGRISHLKGVVASALQIKPIIGFEKSDGQVHQIGRARTFSRAVQELVNWIARKYAPGSALHIQAGHSSNPQGLSLLCELLDKTFDCRWLPQASISPILGAHSGPTLVGVAYAPAEVYEGLPKT